MNKPFARLFALSNDCQVLLTRGYYNEEDGTFEVRIGTQVNGVVITVTHGYETEDEADGMFDTYSQTMAEEFFAAAELQTK